MHAVVMQDLEDYLSGTLTPRVQQEIEAHVSSCDSCRAEIQAFREVSDSFDALRTDQTILPPAGFCARVMGQIEQQRIRPSVTSLLGLDFAFGRRLVFASLLTLAVLGSYLISRETGYPAGPTAEAVLAQQESPAFNSAPGQDNMLVSLTAYEP